MKLELTLFGNPVFRLDGIPVPGFKAQKSKALLCYLAVTGKTCSRSTLAGLFWGDMPESKARMNLSQSLTTLRRLFGRHLVINRQNISFRRDDHYWLDVEAFDSAVGTTGEVHLSSLEQAVHLYKGDFMEGFLIPNAPEFEIWMTTERVRLREQALKALYTLAVHYSEQGEGGLPAAIDYTSRLISLEPWQEEAHRLMMRLLASSGQRSKALLQYERCRQVLGEDLGVEPGRATTALYERVRDGDFDPFSEWHLVSTRGGGEKGDLDSSRKTVPEQPTVLTNLPSLPIDFVGRERDLEALDDLITNRGTRLVTLVGPGGIGKTRLALEFAGRRLRSNYQTTSRRERAALPFPHGIFFISLESIPTKELIFPAIADAMRFKLDLGEDQLADYLRAKKVLLILDNFEYLLDGADKLSKILKSAPYVHILVTSLEHLNLQEEQVYPLQGLEFPPIDQAPQVAEYPAGRLFIQTAQRQQPGYFLDESESEKLTQICQLVEGMPLALELAASWSDTLSMSQIASEIQKNFDFLAANYRNVPARHHSVRAVCDVSWGKLTPEDKRIFSQLCIFRGGFTREAAVKVTGASDLNLSTLVSKSFLRYSKSQDRFSIHALLHQYGGGKLAEENSIKDEVKERHSQYYCELLGDQVSTRVLRSRGQKAVLDTLTIELENIRAAIDWAVEGHHLDRLFSRTTAVGLYYAWRGGYQEGERTLASFNTLLKGINQSDEPQGLYIRASLLNWQAFFLNELGDRAKALDLLLESWDLLTSPHLFGIDTRTERAHNLVNQCRVGWWRSAEERMELLTRARNLYREVGQTFGLPYALNASASLSLVTGKLDQCQQFYEESLVLYDQSGNLLGKATTLEGMGNLAFAMNEYPKAKEYLEQALDIARNIGDQQRIVNASLALGTVYLYWGKFDQARSVLERCAADYADIGFKIRQAAALYYLGYASLHLGEYADAIRYGKEALPMARELHYEEIIAQAMMLPAAVDLKNGDFARALEGFQEAEKVLVSKHFTRVLYGEDCGQLGIATALLQLDQEDEAHTVLLGLLEEAIAEHRQDKLSYALVGIALLFSKQGEALSAVEIYSLAESQPFVGNSAWFSNVFGKFIEATSNTIPRSQVDEAKILGKNRDLWGTADEVLLELG